MKHLVTTLAAVTAAGSLAACSKQPETPAAAAPAPVATAPAAATDSMASANGDMSKMAMAADAKMGKGTGTVTAVTADSVTIDHGPIAEANWPAMTMTFKAAPEIAKSVKAGEKVNFDVKLQGGGGEVTAIQKP